MREGNTAEVVKDQSSADFLLPPLKLTPGSMEPQSPHLGLEALLGLFKYTNFPPGVLEIWRRLDFCQNLRRRPLLGQVLLSLSQCLDCWMFSERTVLYALRVRRVTRCAIFLVGEGGLPGRVGRRRSCP